MGLIGSENDAKAIDVAHRKASGAMIVRFKSREQRDQVYLKRFNLIGKTSAELGFDLPTPGNPIYINENLSFERARLMKAMRDRVKVLNEGVSKDDRIKLKSEQGKLKVHNRAGKFVKVSKIEQFNAIYPNDD